MLQLQRQQYLTTTCLRLHQLHLHYQEVNPVRLVTQAVHMGTPLLSNLLERVQQHIDQALTTVQALEHMIQK